MSSAKHPWTTMSELEFIKTAVEKRDRRGSIDFLEKYIAGASNRAVWDHVDKEQCIRFASILLEDAKAGRLEIIRQ